MHMLVRENSGLFKYEERFKRAFVGILFVHILSVALAYFGLPDFHFKKRPDLTIELSVMAPSAGGQNNSASSPSSLPKKIDEKRLIQDRDGQSINKNIANAPSNILGGSSGPAAAETSDADYKAAYLKNPKPPYPPMAVKMRLEGKVVLLIEVLPDGKAGRVGVESSSGHELLDGSALETVKKWQFAPARKDGVIISQVVRIPITFNLKSQ